MIVPFLVLFPQTTWATPGVPVAPPASIAGYLSRCDDLDVWAGRQQFFNRDLDSNGHGRIMGVELRCSVTDRFDLGVGGEYVEARKSEQTPTELRNWYMPVLGFYLGPRFSLISGEMASSTRAMLEGELYIGGYAGYYSLQNAKLTHSDKAGQISMSGDSFGADLAFGGNVTFYSRHDEPKKQTIQKSRKKTARAPDGTETVEVEEWSEEVPTGGSTTTTKKIISLGFEATLRYLEFSSVSNSGSGHFQNAIPSVVGAPDRLNYDGFGIALSLEIPLGKK